MTTTKKEQKSMSIYAFVLDWFFVLGLCNKLYMQITESYL